MTNLRSKTEQFMSLNVRKITSQFLVSGRYMIFQGGPNPNGGHQPIFLKLYENKELYNNQKNWSERGARPKLAR